MKCCLSEIEMRINDSVFHIANNVMQFQYTRMSFHWAGSRQCNHCGEIPDYNWSSPSVFVAWILEVEKRIENDLPKGMKPNRGPVCGTNVNLSLIMLTIMVPSDTSLRRCPGNPGVEPAPPPRILRLGTDRCEFHKRGHIAKAVMAKGRDIHANRWGICESWIATIVAARWICGSIWSSRNIDVSWTCRKFFRNRRLQYIIGFESEFILRVRGNQLLRQNTRGMTRFKAVQDVRGDDEMSSAVQSGEYGIFCIAGSNICRLRSIQIWGDASNSSSRTNRPGGVC